MADDGDGDGTADPTSVGCGSSSDDPKGRNADDPSSPSSHPATTTTTVGPATEPPGTIVSILVTIVLLPIVAFIVLLSVPVNVSMSLWCIVSSPFVRRRLERLERENWRSDDRFPFDASSPIIVVGAGIGGLSLAHFLIRCGHPNVKVFEKSGDCGLDRGGGHGLISGSWCFRSMGMPDVYRETVNPATVWKFDSGRSWLSAALEFRWMHSNPFLPGLSYDIGNFLRSDFLRHLSETLPAGVLHLNHELTGIEFVSETEVRAIFAAGGGNKAPSSCSGRLLVGCDGSNSRVRELLLSRQAAKDGRAGRESPASPDHRGSTTPMPSADPFYVDINVWWCVTKLSDIPVPERGGWDTGPSRRYFEGGAIMHLVAKENLILVVDYRAQSLRKGHKNWKANSTGEDLLEFMKVWGIPTRYWPAAKHASRVAQFAIPKGLGSDEAALWHNSTTVALLGDAIHPTPHFFGQGANAAIQDAYCLVRCLRTASGEKSGDGGDGGLVSRALEEYVKVRKPPADDIISKSYLLGLTETAGGIARVARDLIFFTVLKTGLFVWAAVDINTVRV